MPYAPCAGGCGKEIKTRIGKRNQPYCGDPCKPGDKKKEATVKPRTKAQPARPRLDDEKLDLGGG